MAEQKLAACEKQLDSDKVAPEARKRNPQWRSLEADVRTYRRRILAVKEIEDREAAAAERANETVEADSEE